MIMKNQDWFDSHVEVIGPHSKAIKAKLKQGLADEGSISKLNPELVAIEHDLDNLQPAIDVIVKKTDSHNAEIKKCIRDTAEECSIPSKCVTAHGSFSKAGITKLFRSGTSKDACQSIINLFNDKYTPLILERQKTIQAKYQFTKAELATKAKYQELQKRFRMAELRHFSQ